MLSNVVTCCTSLEAAKQMMQMQCLSKEFMLHTKRLSVEKSGSWPSSTFSSFLSNYQGVVHYGEHGRRHGGSILRHMLWLVGTRN